ncbi:MAG TPA: efflux RND transporter periplasmic adaptor subunit, partial [Draconibacterium sp.]|nr:efflux RND transporter periplasmic adaptor subunit [Draconibacterium sp.]
RVGGPLLKLNVKQGDYVKQGEVIAEIDKRDYKLQLETTKAQFEQTESEYMRYKQLIEQDKIPENTFEKIKSGYLMTKTAYENAQNQLRDTELKAPFSGYIYEKFVENFQTVGAGTPIVSIIDNSHLEAVVSVSESQLQRVKGDKGSYLNVANAGISNLPVKLLSVSEKTMQDGLYEVKFSFENKNDLKVAPGMTAEVTIYNTAEQNQLSVAASAVFHEKTSTYVWVFNPSTNKVQKREVKIALDGSQGRVNIVSGVNNREQVVTAGVHYLVEGQKVQPIKTPSVTNIGGLL